MLLLKIFKKLEFIEYAKLKLLTFNLDNCKKIS